MFPHGFCFAGRVAVRGALDSSWTAVIAWTRVHAIIKCSTCVLVTLSDHDRRDTRWPRGAWRIVRSSSTEDRAIVIWRPPANPRGTLWRVGSSSGAIFIGRPWGLMEELHDRGPIAPRSRRDRAAIVECSMRNQLHDCRRCFREDLQRDQRPIDAWSGHDGGRSWSIPAKSVAKKCGNCGKIDANSWPLPKLRHRPKEPLPRPLQTASTTAPMATLVGPNFLL